MPGGRPSKFSDICLEQVEKLAKKGWTDFQMSNFFDVHVSTWYRWKGKYPMFCDALKSWKEEADENIERSLYEKAMGYTVVEVTKERRISDSRQESRHRGEHRSLSAKGWEDACTFFDWKCAYCGKECKLTKDHVLPLNNGGDMRSSNIIPACSSCNSSKSDLDMEEWYSSREFFSVDRIERIRAYIESCIALDGKEPEMVVVKEVTKQVAPDTTAIIFWLRNRMSGKWKDTRAIDHTSSDGSMASKPTTIELVAPDVESTD